MLARLGRDSFSDLASAAGRSADSHENKVAFPTSSVNTALSLLSLPLVFRDAKTFGKSAKGEYTQIILSERRSFELCRACGRSVVCVGTVELSREPAAHHDVTPDDICGQDVNREMLLHSLYKLKLRQARVKPNDSSSDLAPSLAPLVHSNDIPDQDFGLDVCSQYLLDCACKSNLQQVILRLMDMKCAGPFLENQGGTALGLRTVEQRLNDGIYADAAGQLSPELFWSDIDECLEICESSGRLPMSVWEMRTCTQQLEEEFWEMCQLYESSLYATNPCLKPVAAAALAVWSKFDHWLDAYAVTAGEDRLTDTAPLCTGSGSSYASIN